MDALAVLLEGVAVIPWWVWVVVALAWVAAAARLLGLRAGMVSAAVWFVAVSIIRATQARLTRKTKEAKTVEDLEQGLREAVRNRREANSSVDKMDSGRVDSEWNRWLRDRE